MMQRCKVPTYGLSLLLLGLICLPVEASIYTGEGADPFDWFDPDNWGPSAAFGGDGDVPELNDNPAFGATFGNDAFTFNQVGATAQFLVIGSTGGQFPFNIEGGDLTYGGDGLFGINGFDGATFGPATINHTAGVLKQVGGGAGMFIGHSQPATYNISGGMLIMETMDRQLGIDSPDFGGSGNASFLNIFGTGVVEVGPGVNIRIGPAGVLDILDEGQLIWRNRTLDEVAALGGSIRATAEQVGPDVVFTTDRSPEVLLVLNIDRDTGAMGVSNSTGAPVDIASYSIGSQAGVFDASNWTSIAATGDSDSGGSIDPNNVWNEFSAGGPGDLSEGTVGMASIADGGTLSLDDGVNGPWAPYFVESSDISFQYLTGAGDVVGGLVQFSGNGGNPFGFGDLDFDGQPINSADWDAFVDGYGTDLTGLSVAEAYRQSDLNGDGIHSVADFNQFKQIFETANGAGSFAAMLAGVPEPTSLLIAVFGLLLSAHARFRTEERVWKTLAIVFVATFVGVGLDSGAEASTWTNAAGDNDWFNPDNWDVLGDGSGGAEAGGVPDQPLAIGMSVGAVPLDFNQVGATAQFAVAGNNVNITGGDLTYVGDGLWGSSILGGMGGIADDCLAGGSCPVFTQTGGTITQTGGGAGLIVAHNIPGTYDISGGQVVVQNTSPALIVDSGELFTSSNPGTLSISGNGVVDVQADRLRFGPQATLNVTGDGVLIWRNHTVDDVFSTLSGGVFQDAKVIADSAVINAQPIQMGNDVHFVEGFTPVEPLQLTVNTVSGELVLSGATVADDINFYELTSEMNSLNPTDWATSNLDAQNIDVLGGDSNESWSTLTGTTGNLTEAFLSGSSVFDSSRSESLGFGYNAQNDSEDARDLVMLIGTTNGNSRTIPVEYFEPMGLPGDYNDDGILNAADYTVWRDNLGEMVILPNEDPAATTPGLVDQEDYGFWKSQFGQTTGALGSTAAVPEPTTLTLLLMLTMVASLLHCRRSGAPAWLPGLTGMFTVFCAFHLNIAVASTLERDYQLGDDALENASTGGVLGNGAGNPSPGSTLDSFGPLPGTFIDIGVVGNPTYVDVSDRPGAVGGDLGGAFDGNGDALLTAISMNSPSGMSNNLEFFPQGYLRNYSGIFAHGIELWAKPSPGGLNGQRQDLIIDTPQHGIFITENNTWALQFAGGAVDSEIAVDTSSDGGWTHVMQIAGFNDTVLGRSSTGGALLVNGVAVAASPNTYANDSTALAIGSNQANDGNFYNGTLDDVRLFLWGDNSGSGPLTQDWGPLNLAEDNEWIAQEFAARAADAGVGAIPDGDINFDGVVSGDGSGAPENDDIAAFVGNWLTRNIVDGVQVGDWLSRQNADLNFDGVVDLFDWQILRDGHPNGSGLSLGALLAVNGVPEPSTATCALVLFLLVTALRRRT